MSVLSVLAPAFVQVALCFCLLLGMIGARRLSGAQGGRDGPWPARAERIRASYANQFEIPVLFLGLLPLALLTHKADAVFVVLEWIFVVGRLAQAAVHVTVNVVPLRGVCFLVGCMALGLAWAKLALDLIASST